MPIQHLINAQMKKEPVLIRRFSLNQQALRAQEFLRNEGIEAFIFMDATWSGGGETQQGIRLVVKPSDAKEAATLLQSYDGKAGSDPFMQSEKKEGRFYLQVAWLVSILFAFLLGSFLIDKNLDGTEMAVGCVFLVTAGYFFLAANMQKKKNVAV